MLDTLSYYACYFVNYIIVVVIIIIFIIIIIIIIIIITIMVVVVISIVFGCEYQFIQIGSVFEIILKYKFIKKKNKEINIENNNIYQELPIVQLNFTSE